MEWIGEVGWLLLLLGVMCCLSRLVLWLLGSLLITILTLLTLYAALPLASQ
jgi:multisubunit Na+/H+ antiporter MnhG subunit